MPKHKKEKQKSIKQILKAFCDDSSVSACKFLTMKNVSYTERLLWSVFNVALATLTMYLIYFLCTEYAENPIIVTLESSHFPIQNVNHPGISICNVNKISKKRAYEMVEPFSKSLHVHSSFLLEDMKLFGRFYDLNIDAEGIKRHFMLDELLKKHDNLSEQYDITRLLLLLTPPCREILKECKWGGRQYPCQDLFLTRMTYEGFCCVFNYARPHKRGNLYKDINFREVPTVSEVPQGSGHENGLIVTLAHDLEDNFYNSMETDGFNIHIFYPYDFPDKLSGSLTEIFVTSNMEALITIEADVIQSSPEIRMLPTNKRRCKFEDEETTLFGSYRESDCYVSCRVESLQSLCNCIPFTIPNVRSAGKKISTCTLNDFHCLNKYRGKWSRYFPHGAEADHFEQEIQDSISCEQCLPPCNNIHYNAFTSFGAANVSVRDDNVSRVAIFFNKAFCNLYKVDLTSLWFEELSSFGGMLSLFLGLSLISVVEILILSYKIMLLLTKFLLTKIPNY